MVVRALTVVVRPVDGWLNAPDAGLWRSGLAGLLLIAVYWALAVWSGINSLAILGAVGALGLVATHGRQHRRTHDDDIE